MTSPLDEFDAERADFQRVLDAVATLGTAPLEKLHSLEWLVELIRGVGVVPIPEAAATYQGEEDFLNASQQGVVQLPREFARWLLLLSALRPATYVEIGCFNGATACLATAYLQRFNPALKAITIDLWPGFRFYSQIAARLPLQYAIGKTSFDFAGAKYDAVFIDGDHSFDWAWADFQNVGRAAKMCALHDVNNAPYRELPCGGVCAVWELIRRDEAGEFIEIFEHPSRDIMGIGVRVAPGI